MIIAIEKSNANGPWRIDVATESDQSCRVAEVIKKIEAPTT